MKDRNNTNERINRSDENGFNNNAKNKGFVIRIKLPFSDKYSLALQSNDIKERGVNDDDYNPENGNSAPNSLAYKENTDLIREVSGENIEVSIIMPSYNKYPLNILSLYSLEKQTFDPSKMEVIFIDDCSTDETSLALKGYKPPFAFRYIENQENLGRAKVRNKGVEMARGKTIIFLDAEMIVEPEFVENHYNEHQKNEMLVLTGAFHLKNSYTSFFPQFSAEQKYRLESLIKKHRGLYMKYVDHISKDAQDTAPLALLSKEHIQEGLYKQLSAEQSYFANEIRIYGENLEGFNFPWMAFLTGNVSLSKKLFIEAGEFDEGFILYGYEDWELGYRLYKMGATFKAKKNLASYHQEHPIIGDKRNEAIINYYYFTQKHPEVDILMLGLELARIVDLGTMNEVLKEYKDLIKHYPSSFKSFKNGFFELLKTVALLLRYDIRHRFLSEATGFGIKEKENILLDIESMRILGKYTALIELMEKKLLMGSKGKFASGISV